VFEASNTCDHGRGQRTAKWTAITRRLTGTHRHAGALSSQADATNAQDGELFDLHGMQEARGSSPLAPLHFKATISNTEPMVLTAVQGQNEGQPPSVTLAS